MRDKTGLPQYNNPRDTNSPERRGFNSRTGTTPGSTLSDITPFLDNTAGGTDALLTKAPTSNVMYDHGVASTGIHGVGASTIASVANITTHAAVTSSVHNFDGSGNAPPQNHATNHTNGTDDIQDATAAQKGLATAAQITKLDGIEAGANATPASYSRSFHVNGFHFPDPASEWKPTVYGAYLAASLTSKKCWIPLNFLKAGDIITAYNLVGDAIETNALTLDCKLVQINKADPLTTTDITNGAIAQVTADGNFDVAANPDDTTVTTDKQYVLEILGTTGVADEIYVIGAELTITRLI